MLSKGGLNFPAVCVWGGGGWPLVGRVYRSRLTVVSRGLVGGEDNRELIPILTQNLGLRCGRNRLWGEGRGGLTNT